MANRKFSLVGQISTENPKAVKRVLQAFMPARSITATEDGLERSSEAQAPAS